MSARLTIKSCFRRQSLFLLVLSLILLPEVLVAQEAGMAIDTGPESESVEPAQEITPPTPFPRAPYRKARSQVQIAAPELDDAERVKEYGAGEGSDAAVKEELEDVFGQ
jgi:hypothetical protein